jgi:chemotaxis signal transduction protein
VAQLRRAFDDAFAHVATSAAPERISVIGVRVGEQLFGVRAEDIDGVYRVEKMLELPAARAGLAGVQKVGGSMTAVFSLAYFLELGSESQMAFFVSFKGAHAIGLGFETLDGYLEVERAKLTPVEQKPPRSAYINAVMRTESGLRSLLDCHALRAVIEARQQTS